MIRLMVVTDILAEAFTRGTFLSSEEESEYAFSHFEGKSKLEMTKI